MPPATAADARQSRASRRAAKLYTIVEDDFAARHDLVRVMDESGEGYLYPSAYFVRVALPKPVTSVRTS